MLFTPVVAPLVVILFQPEYTSSNSCVWVEIHTNYGQTMYFYCSRCALHLALHRLHLTCLVAMKRAVIPINCRHSRDTGVVARNRSTMLTVMYSVSEENWKLRLTCVNQSISIARISIVTCNNNPKCQPALIKKGHVSQIKRLALRRKE